MTLSLGIVYHPDYLLHDTGYGHPESPQRLEWILHHIKERRLCDDCEVFTPEPASLKWISKNHDMDYIKRVENCCREGHQYIDSADTAIGPQSYQAAITAVGGVLQAFDMVMEGKWNRALCLVRPPGHHAERNMAAGFCLFNNIAIGGYYLLEQFGLQRVMIIDWDVHHGNGTQNSFYNENRVFYFSIHQYPHYPGREENMKWVRVREKVTR